MMIITLTKLYLRNDNNIQMLLVNIINVGLLNNFIYSVTVIIIEP